jgi:hypothetical protein
MNVFEDENNKYKFNIKPISDYSVFEFLDRKKQFVNVEVVPKKFLEERNLGQNNYYLSGFDVAVLKNDLEMVKKILDWAEKYQHVESEIFEFFFLKNTYLNQSLILIEII